MPTTTCFDLIVYARLLGKQLFAGEIDAATASVGLLQMLLRCASQRQGALLLCLPEPYSDEVAHIFELHFPLIQGTTVREQWYLLASQEISMQQLVQILPSLHMREAAGPATSLAEGRIIYSPLPIALPSQCVQEALVSERVSEPWKEVREPFFHLPPDATLIMIQTADGVPHVANQPVHNPFPSCVEEAAGAALMTMFLALLSLHTASSGGDCTQAQPQATLSHELRSPLAAIKGYTHILLRYEHRIQPEERREFLQEIDEASSHLASLVDRLIELSQLETGTLPFEFCPTNLVTLIEQTLLTTQSRWEQPGPTHEQQLRFLLRLEDEKMLGEPLVFADPQRLREVLDMLLDNAVKYSPQGGEIEIILRRPSATNLLFKQERSRHESQARFQQARKPGEAFIELCVRDHGIGIPAQQLQHIFHRFHRIDMSLTREVSGLGIGLTLCKHIIHKHRGHIWIESTVGMGSTVHVLFPAYQGEVDSVL
jgi:signal transduction histidine kinase